MSTLESHLAQSAGVDPETLARARERQRDGKPIESVLQDMGLLTPARWGAAVAEHFGLPFVEDLPPGDIPLDLVATLPIQFAKRHVLIPIARDGDTVILATADPANPGPIDDLRVLFRCSIRAVVAPAAAIVEAINRAYDQASASTAELVSGLDEERLDLDVTELDEPQDLLDAGAEAPIIRLVNQVIYQSVKDRASDIHIEPFERELIIRFRIDGLLYDVVKPPKRFQPVIASRVKIMAGLNIAEKRLPQDGRISTKIAGRDIDIRVSVIPTAFGERIVMRLLDRSSTLMSLEDLGLAGPNQVRVQRLIRQNHGIILVTGPTGSGKTTTLYASLQKINSSDKNIITIEDPIEYQLEGVGQMQVNPKIELTFASGLRSILRQDPDVIMVGEIRDVETAEIAIHAALTGHLVFSTLHTNDSFGAVTRLVDMGIEPFLVSSSVIAVMAQRLVRRVCLACRVDYAPTEEELREVGLAAAEVSGPIYRPGEGCPECKQTGYRGRIGIHELLVVDDDVRGEVMKNSDAATIQRQATAKGMLTLRDDGARKVAHGMTTIEEILRVTQEDLVIE